MSGDSARAEIPEAEVEALRERLREEAERSGYYLNPDLAFTAGLVRGLLVNERRYGYQSCPCRLASAVAEEDRDIVCPCDYRDPDLVEHGACYCALYVTREVRDGTRKLHRVPERRGVTRPEVPEIDRHRAGGPELPVTGLPHPVWRCRVCGYLCARGMPPEVCPICRAKKDQFERFL